MTNKKLPLCAGKVCFCECLLLLHLWLGSSTFELFLGGKVVFCVFVL